MEFAILIPVFNHLELTGKMLDSLQAALGQCQGAKFHVIVIDDGSTDGTSEWVEKNHPEVVLLKGDGNLWWSGAVNVGASHALDVLKVDYLVLWNNDISFREDYFTTMVRAVNNSEMPVILGSKIYVDENPEQVWSMGGFFDPRNGKYDMYAYYADDAEEFQKDREVDWLTGMGTVIPAGVVREIGTWNQEQFPQYHGDSDFTYRAKLAGYRNILKHELKLYNSVGHSGLEHEDSFRKLMGLMTDIRSKINIRKNVLFYRKYARSPRAYLPLVKLYFIVFAGFFKWKILGLFGAGKGKGDKA